MNTQHTPGPWATCFDHHQGQGTTAFEQYAEGNNGQQFDIKILSHKGRLIATVPAAHKSGYSKVIAHSDARLIAAAPDLLRVAESLCGLAELRPGHLQDYKAAISDARAAIKKARGEA